MAHPPSGQPIPLGELLDFRQSKSRSQTPASLPWVVTPLTPQEVRDRQLILCLNVNQTPLPQSGAGHMTSLPHLF